MKKSFKSRGFLASALTLSCIGILIACWYVSRDQTAAFQPEEAPSVIQSLDWKENQGAAESHTEETDNLEAYVPPRDSDMQESLDTYPVVSEVSESEVSIDFTPTETPAETPPSPPEGKTLLEDAGPEHPVNPAPEVTAPEPEASSNNEPSAGDTNQDGAIYDPVFGWVVSGKVTQSTLDSDGDPNKMVGNMGN